MFTGIIEHLGTVELLQTHATGGRLTIHAPMVAPHLTVANSIAVNGCCLTVVKLEGERFSADLSPETLRKTSIGSWKRGTRVNLEQPMTAGREFGGHFVLGHVDTIGRVARLEADGENWWYGVEAPEPFAKYVVAQGSIAIDGISLTVSDSGIGFDWQDATNRRGLGLISMRERLRLVNGELSIQSELARGTTVRAQVRLEHNDDSKAIAG